MLTNYFKTQLCALVCLMCTSQLFSQDNAWVWIHGDNIINYPGVYANQVSVAPGTKPGARSGSASWTDRSGKFWLMGGFGYGATSSLGVLNDLWSYDPALNEWSWINGSENPNPVANYGTQGVTASSNHPGGRQLAATWADLSGNLWLFGGSGDSYYNDLWKFDLATQQWTWMKGSNSGNARGVYGTKGIASPSNMPGARHNAACWADNSGNLWLYGGNGYGESGGGGYLGDLWKYNIQDNSWTWIKGEPVVRSRAVYGEKKVAAENNRPSSRMGSACWIDANNNLWLHGGYGTTSGSSLLNDLWKYNISRNEWVCMHGDSIGGQLSEYGTTGMSYGGNKPGGVYNAATWKDAMGYLYMFGGRGNSDRAFGELNALWRYDIAMNQWALIRGDRATYISSVYGELNIPDAMNKPGSREKPVAWADSLGNPWLFGGESYPLSSTVTEFNNDLWKLAPISSLPVKLTGFTGKEQAKNILLQWQVSGEANLKTYVVERSIDGINFRKAGTVPALNLPAYEFTDYAAALLNEKMYYRLKMVDADGEFAYSHILIFRGEVKNNFVIYPNPVKDQINFRFLPAVKGKIDAMIIDTGGKTVFAKRFDVNGAALTFPIHQLTSGIYQVVLLHEDGKVSTQQLVVAR